jgi:hypothetical protein
MTFDSRSPLRTCHACARHVFATETSCPFCAAVLAPMPVRPRFKLSPRLSRAQRFALAGALVGLIGCDSEPVPLYGAPPLPRWDGGTGSGGAGASDSGVAIDAGDDAGDDDGGPRKD